MCPHLQVRLRMVVGEYQYNLGCIFMLKNLLLASAVATLPVSALAMTINGQIDISGTVNIPSSDFTVGGNVDLNDPGFVIFATDDFASVPLGSLVTLTDIDFSAPGAIWSVGGFTYTATSYSHIIDGTEVGFMSYGVITGAGFDATDGMLNFSALLFDNSTGSSTCRSPAHGYSTCWSWLRSPQGLSRPDTYKEGPQHPLRAFFVQFQHFRCICSNLGQFLT